MKKAEIKLTIDLDDNNVPESITWESTDAENKEALPVKSMMLALWDHNYKNTLRIDLWTKDMMVDEMKKFYIQNILTLTDTFQKATGDDATAAAVKDFFSEVGKRIGVLQ